MYSTPYRSAEVMFGVLIGGLIIDIAVGKTRHGKNIYGICPESKRTVNEVSQCPKNQEEWNRRKDEMNCESIQQSCTTAEKFVYHCLPDSNWNKTMEVCAPRIRIVLQKCAEYNEEGMRIQPNFEHSCSDTENPCPVHYSSENAYKYQQCYKKTKSKVLIGKPQPKEIKLKPTLEISCCSSGDSFQPLCMRTVLLLTVALRIYHVHVIVT